MTDHSDSFVFEVDDGDFDIGAIFVAAGPISAAAQEQISNPFSVEGNFDFEYVPTLATNAFEHTAPHTEIWENDFSYEDAQPDLHHHVDIHIQ